MRLHHVLMSAALVALIVMAAGCSKQSPLAPTPSPVSRAGALPASRTVPAGAVHLTGEIGPGALYTIDVPAEWNGDLVLYAHGYTEPQRPVALPGGAFPGVRDQVLARGFAIAATSFSSNGYAEAEGVRQVHQLRGLFQSRVGTAANTYLVGSSLGALVSVELLQNYPGQFAGALAVSGPVGGSKAEFDYVGDVRALWDLLMPYKLAGTFMAPAALPLPTGDIVQCIQQNQQLFGMAALARREGGFPVAGKNGNELAYSVASTLGFHWYGMADAIDRAHGHMPYGNDGVLYVGSLPPSALAMINAGITRYEATPDAGNFMRQHYEPDGRLERPLLTLHAQRDPLVPFGHEALLGARVAQAGNQEWLSQSGYDRFGHTEAFTAPELVNAFDALVMWVRTGTKPASPVPLGP